MKKVFKVVLYMKDGSRNRYNIVAKNDYEARNKAEDMEEKSFTELTNRKYPGLDYAEIELICKLDGE